MGVGDECRAVLSTPVPWGQSLGDGHGLGTILAKIVHQPQLSLANKLFTLC